MAAASGSILSYAERRIEWLAFLRGWLGGYEQAGGDLSSAGPELIEEAMVVYNRSRDRREDGQGLG